MNHPCICRPPPFVHGDYLKDDLGEDIHDAQVTVFTCRHGASRWLHHLT